jgi:hypothetical protein
MTSLASLHGCENNLLINVIRVRILFYAYGISVSKVKKVVCKAFET